VGEIMKPRVDIFSLDIRDPFRVVFDRMIELGYSRFPVYEKDLDDIRGILYVKDLLSHVQKTNAFRWQSLIRPAFFVPENKRINDLLQEFRQNKMHMAIVVDEYGGTSGLITLEDILEEIVGEIRDESDEEDTMIQKIGDRLYLCNAKTSLHDLEKALELEEGHFDEAKGGSETLAGLILELRGELPEPGEQIQLNNLTFVIKSRDDRRIKEVEIKISQGI
jgi:CBS domain containing-hemolysin-like protein